MNISIDDLLKIISSSDVTVVAGHNGSCERAIGQDKLIAALEKLQRNMLVETQDGDRHDQ